MSDPGTVALTAVTVACVAANVFIVVADLSRARFVLANSAEVGVRPHTLPHLAALKGAGALGLVLGLAGAAPLGLAAAAGLVVFYLSAVAAHLRASAFSTIAFPLAFLASAAGAVTHFAVAIL